MGGNEFGTLNVSNSFFVETNGDGDKLGGEAKTLDEFADGTVALLLHNWCETEEEDEICKEDGLDGSVWGQNVGQTTDNDAAPTLSGVLKLGPLTIAKNAAGKDSTAIDGASELEMKIPAEFNVPSVTFKRSFAVGYSTMMLPFGVSAENKPAELEFYSFDKVEEINGKYTASYNPVNAGSGLNAHTP